MTLCLDNAAARCPHAHSGNNNSGVSWVELWKSSATGPLQLSVVMAHPHVRCAPATAEAVVLLYAPALPAQSKRCCSGSTAHIQPPRRSMDAQCPFGGPISLTLPSPACPEWTGRAPGLYHHSIRML